MKLEGVPGHPEPETSAVAVYTTSILLLVRLVNTSLVISLLFPDRVNPETPLAAADQEKLTLEVELDN